MKTFILLLAVSSAFAGLTIKDFEGEFHELWSDKSEEIAASQELKDEENSIEEHNADYESGKSSYSEKLNELSALTKEEFEAEKEGLISHGEYATGLVETPEEFRKMSPEKEAKLQEIYETLDRAYTPPSFDARQTGIITKPKNQMSCGSCAAFAATSVHETCMATAGAPVNGLDLSEQQLVDCGYNGNSMNGCHGAWLGAYQDWIADANIGYSHESQYPYQDRDPNLSCQNKPTWKTGAKITDSLVDYSCNEDKLKKLVYKYGAVATGIYASDKGLSNVGYGVFDGCSTTQINHAVTVVGYGTQNGKDYWIVKNSWGDNWGDNGYVKIARGSRMCGIGGNCALTLCQKYGTAEPAPVAPPPPPIPANQICDISVLYGNGNITGHYTLRTKINGKEYVAEVKCENSKCSPAIAGPSNACMYICGKLKC